MGYAVAAMNGSPFQEYWINEYDKETIWDLIIDADGPEQNIVTAGSIFCGTHDESTSDGV